MLWGLALKCLEKHGENIQYPKKTEMGQADPGISSGPEAFMVCTSYHVVASTPFSYLPLWAEHLDGLRNSNQGLY